MDAMLQAWVEMEVERATGDNPVAYLLKALIDRVIELENKVDMLMNLHKVEENV